MILPRAAEDAMLAHAQQAAPGECCGLLVGQGDRVIRAVSTRNAAADPVRRFVVDPKDYFETIREARTESLEVIGVYHSHPRSAAIPSATDRAEAFADFLFVIVGLGVFPPDITAWRWTGGNFDQLPLVRCP